MIKATTKQFVEHLDDLVRRKQYCRECTPHLYKNWIDWLVYTAYEKDICRLRRNQIGVIKVINDMRELHLFVSRTWDDNAENDWAWASFWKRSAIALAAVSLHELHRSGAAKQRLKPYNRDDVNRRFEAFIKAIGLEGD